MKKILFNCLCVLLIVISVVLMGCSSLLDHVTPAWPDSEIEEYLTAPIVPGDENYCQQEDLKATPVMPYTTLADVKKQRRMIGYKHEDRQQCFKDALRDDKVSYGRTFESIVRSIEDAQSLQDNVEHGFGGIGGPAIIGMAVLVGWPGIVASRVMSAKPMPRKLSRMQWIRLWLMQTLRQMKSGTRLRKRWPVCSRLLNMAVARAWPTALNDYWLISKAIRHARWWQTPKRVM